MKAIVINWFGPFEDELGWGVTINEGGGLYFLCGKLKGQKQDACIQYLGITERDFSKRIAEHRRSGRIGSEINRESEIWVGKIVSPVSYGRSELELAEHMIAYWMRFELNQKKTKSIPAENVAVLSKWYKRDGSPRQRQHSMTSYVPDVMVWDGETWRYSNLSVCIA